MMVRELLKAFGKAKQKQLLENSKPKANRRKTQVVAIER
jgi:hypothetical protein